MEYTKSFTCWGLVAAVAFCVCIFSEPAVAQKKDDAREDTQEKYNRERANRERASENEDNRDRSRSRGRSGRTMRFEDDATSKDNRSLAYILRRYPAADADKDGVLTGKEANAYMPKLMAQWQRRRGGPTHPNVPYGENQNQVMDLYLPDSDKPTPLVVYFHGGQFITGDENDTRYFSVREYLAAGIAVASIDYRDTTIAPFPAPFEDAAKAVQMLRYYAEQINVDPERIAGWGDEAGGNLVLFLAMHDDMAEKPKDKKSDTKAKDGEDEPEEKPRFVKKKEEEKKQEDAEADGDTEDAEPEDERKPWEVEEIKEMSTRLTAAFALHPIATFDPRQWKRLKLPMNDHERLMCKYLGLRFLEPFTDPTAQELVKKISPLELASADDPPVLLTSMYRDLKLEDNTIWTIMRHHPKQIQLIKSRLAAKGVKAIVRYRGMKNDPNIRSIQFLSKQLKVSVPSRP